MLILGIETSCDETAAAVVEDGTKILSNVVASSVKMHAKSGGIIPEVAAREQVRCILPVVDAAIANCKLKIENLDSIAVTVGPGLIGSLLVGVETARTLAYTWNKPIIPINHLVAHIYANWLSPSSLPTPDTQLTSQPHPQFPAIALAVSGGHTDLVLMKGHACPPKPEGRRRGKIRWLGGTRDDAAGECFDKCARVLGLGYPGGPAISTAAEKFKISNLKFKIELPRPMIESNDFDFSFSGLKTAVLREVKKLTPTTHPRLTTHNSQLTHYLSFEIQEAITDVLVEKTIRAAEKYKVKSILLAGGVAANSRLREKIKSSIINHQSSINLFIPPPALCTDNAAIVASCAFFNYKPINWQKISTQPGLSITGEV